MDKQQLQMLSVFLYINGFSASFNEDNMTVYVKFDGDINLDIRFDNIGYIEFTATDESKGEDIIVYSHSPRDNFDNFMDFMKCHINPVKKSYTLSLTFESYYDKKEVNKINIEDIKDVLDAEIYLENLSINLTQN